MKRLGVLWEDSTILRDGWQPIESILKRRNVTRCRTVGFVLADDNRGLVLASSVHGDEAAGVTVIPRGAVVRSKRLRDAT